MGNTPSELFVDGDGQPIKDGDLVRAVGGHHTILVRYSRSEGKDALVFKTRHQTWHLNREDFFKSEWRRVKVSGSRVDVVILDDIATDSEVFTLRALALTHEPFTPPRAGSKGYQRRQNQRWPKGR